jgi:signal transduction histidine kinase
MGELVSSIAHELNNPLTTVSLSVETLIAQTTGDDPRRRKMEIIGKEIERMGNLVSNLLQFSRRSQPQISTVNVCDEIEKTLELIHYHLRKQNIAVAREFNPEGPLIHADRQQLRQLFLNLFTNASDAMPKGGTLTIRVYVRGSGVRGQGSGVRDQGLGVGGQESESGAPETGVTQTPDPRLPIPDPKGKAFVIIEIADTGTGIPPEILPKVTEPFYTTKPEGKGTGLGLAICRRVAQEHHGTLDIVSEGIPGKGTRVCITLPFSNGSNTVSLREE